MSRTNRFRESEEEYLESRQAIYRSTPTKEKQDFIIQDARHVLTLRGLQDDGSEQYTLVLELFRMVCTGTLLQACILKTV